MADPVFDPTYGITDTTSREELLERLRKAATALRVGDRQKKARLQEIEDRLRAKGAANGADQLRVIATGSEAEWTEAIEFLEEFDDLLPPMLSRLVVGGRMLLDQKAKGV